MTVWHHRLAPPPQINMNRVGAANWENFIQSGERIAAAVRRNLEEQFDGDLTGLSILDFGCGSGRALLPLNAALPATRFTGVDIDDSAIDYLRSQCAGLDLRATRFTPPLPFRDASFDAVYSISIWTHLCPEDQIPWLRELVRVVKPGGTILLSVSSRTALQRRQARRDPGWETITSDDLSRDGLIFIAYPEAGKDVWRPNVTGPYGLTLHDAAWIRQHFSPLAEVLDVRIDAVDNCQDLVILRTPGGTARPAARRAVPLPANDPRSEQEKHYRDPSRINEKFLRNLLLSRDGRYIYTMIPKSGNTTVKSLLWEAEQAYRGFPARVPENCPNLHLEEEAPYTAGPAKYAITPTPNCTSFTVVRNPFTRALSGFMDKRDRLGNPTDFKTYLQRLVTIDPFRIDHHFAPQWTICRPDIIAYDHIVPLEDFGQAFRPVHQALFGAEIADYAVANKSPAYDPFAFYDAECVAMVQDYFRLDFDLLGYSTDLADLDRPCEPAPLGTERLQDFFARYR